MNPAGSRRRFLRAALAGAVTGLAGCSELDDPGTQPPREETDSDATPDTPYDTPTGTPPETVGLETVATGFQGALDVAFPPDADRRYVAEQGGRVLVDGPDGVRDEPFLDLGTAEVGGEKGVLDVELHPEFADNRLCYVRYSASPREGTPSGYSHTFVLAEFRATEDGLGVDRDSGRTVLEIPEPQRNHNAGAMEFGPDGLLYVGVGDGGAAGDRGSGHVEGWYDDVPGGNGQDVTENLLGSVLRIDVDAEPTEHPRTDSGAPEEPDGDEGYAVPGDNPLVGVEGLDEHYAWGLRNPWRMSIDHEGSRVEGGPDLYVGDVGQDRFEEVDLVRPGGNYGWNVREGTHCFDPENPDGDCPDSTPEDVRGGEPLLDPIVEYPQEGAAVSGVSVIGGYVYRGDAVAGLAGRYVFGDWTADGELFVADPSDEGLWDVSVLGVAEPGKLERVRSFGRDHDGELYVVASDGSEWGVHRIVEA